LAPAGALLGLDAASMSVFVDMNTAVSTNSAGLAAIIDTSDLPHEYLG
jgi:hypothetical protein